MLNYINTWFLLGVVLVAMISSTDNSRVSSSFQPKQNTVFTAELGQNDRKEIFEKIWKEINDYYYDPKFNGVNWPEIHQKFSPLIDTVKNDSEFYLLLNKMTGELKDSHTRVLSPTMLANLRKQQSGSLGIRLDEIQNQVVVSEVISGSPAAQAGLESGMILWEVNGLPIAKRLEELRNQSTPSSSDRFDRIRSYGAIVGGPPGTSIKLTLRRSDGSVFETTLNRQLLSNVGEVKSRILDSGFGYISFNQFTPVVSKELKATLSKVKASRGLIIDIRNNSGGSSQGLYPIVENFLNSKTLFLRNTTRTGKPLPDLPLEIYLGKDSEQVYSGPIVILVNARSGSTAEMFAAGLQEMGRAKVLGTQTCGCVIGINKQRELKGGGVLQIGEVLWLTPKGRRLEGEGVIPDKIVSPTISDLQQKRDPVIAEAESLLRQLTKS